jgi:hypothetical protein
MGRGWDLNPGKRLHRPLGYQATSPRPRFMYVSVHPDYYWEFPAAVVARVDFVGS